MAEMPTQQSPVMVDSPQVHTFANPDYALPRLSPSTSNRSSTSSTPADMSTSQQESRSLETEDVSSGLSEPQPQEQSQETAIPDTDESSNSESGSGSSTSTETPGTTSTPRSTAQEGGQPVLDSSSTDLDSLPTTDNVAESSSETAQTDEVPQTTATTETNDVPTSSGIVPEPPVDISIPPPIEMPLPIDNTPSWVLYEEDTSEPSESELKDIEANKSEINATDSSAVEARVFEEWDDPEQRPCKKIRLSWVVHGLRGTKERPNRARIITSPSAVVDGKHWSIKLFPRGNKSRSSMAVFLRCSTLAPEPHKESLKGSFKCYEGDPATDLSTSTPIVDMELSPPPPKEPEVETESASKETVPEAQPTPETAPENAENVSENESTSDEDDDDGDRPRTPRIMPLVVSTENFRVSAQLGMVVYNPTEPRTCHISSSSHQFYPDQDDWGWDNAVEYWEDMHVRKPGQRQALLRNDTIAIDAYIRIFDDPTKALFWHPSEGPAETQWDSKGLVGLFPFGTERLHHSPATAGIAAWSLLAPFRKLIQSMDVGKWRTDSKARPRPLIAQLHLMLFQMRRMRKTELYIHLDRIIDEIRGQGETWDTVNNFWEAFQRSLIQELSDDPDAQTQLVQILGSTEQFRALPKLPIRGVDNFQSSAEKAFTTLKQKIPLPNFLPLSLDRQSFDTEKRQWQLHHDRVKLSEELDLSQFTTDQDAKFSLYGFIIHNGVHGSDLSGRTSGRFFSILRPTGPGGRWLAFSDGHGNKVFSLTSKAVKAYEGLEGDELKNFTGERETIHTALYVRTSKLEEYLVSELEDFKLASWLKNHLAESYNHNPDHFDTDNEVDISKSVPIEVFWDRSISGQVGKLDLYKIKSGPLSHDEQYWQKMTADSLASIADLKKKIAETLAIDVTAIKLWTGNYIYWGHASKSCMSELRQDNLMVHCIGSCKHLCIWLSVAKDKYEIEEETLLANFKQLNGIHIEGPPPPPKPVAEPIIASPPDTETAPSTEGQALVTDAENAVAAAPDAEQAAVRDAVSQSAGSPQDTEETVANTNANAPATPEPVQSAVDEEQAAIGDAVQQTISQLAVPESGPTTQVAEVDPSDTSSLPRSNASSLSAPAGETAVDAAGEVAQLSNSETLDTSSVPITPVETSSVSNDQAFDSIASARSSDLPSAPVEALSTTENNLTTSETSPSTSSSSITEADDATGTAPSTTTAIDILTASGSEVLLTHGNPLPIGIPIAVGHDQILLMQPLSGDDISAEDAALIQSMIAADLAAAERERIANGGEADQEETSDTGDDDVVESRPQTPRPIVREIYGFLHIFDAENQTITAHSTFTATDNVTVSSAIRKQLGYDEEKSFHLWKRIGTYRTAGISSESTFAELTFADCREIFVGDHLGEPKIEALKRDAKFIDPGQLMRHLAMVSRGHPISTLTTEELIELCDFGGDYYKGPILRGQRHGADCKLITKTGDQYAGPLLSGQKSGGKGKMLFQNGDVYDGEWLDDQKHGQGEFLEKRTGNRYVGGYENDKRWGKGVTYWEQADQQAALCQVCYFEEVDALFYRCGHVVACYACAKQCAADSAQCPVCRKPIETVVKMYRS